MPSIIGLDPGGTGAGCFIDRGRMAISVTRFKWKREIVQEWFHNFNFALIVGCEQVHGRPGDTPTTAFGFGRNVGKMQDRLDIAGMLISAEVHPQVWQREFSIANKMEYQDRQHKQQVIAQALFPEIKVTLDMAAAMLIAEYFWRKYNGVLESEKRIKEFDASVKRGVGVVGKSSVRKR